jgi:coenzyme PQQ precursor peptide PqqA
MQAMLKFLRLRRKERPMEWTSPQFEEICLNCEINSYATAEL